MVIGVVVICYIYCISFNWDVQMYLNYKVSIPPPTPTPNNSSVGACQAFVLIPYNFLAVFILSNIGCTTYGLALAHCTCNVHSLGNGLCFNLMRIKFESGVVNKTCLMVPWLTRTFQWQALSSRVPFIGINLMLVLLDYLGRWLKYKVFWIRLYFGYWKLNSIDLLVV